MSKRVARNVTPLGTYRGFDIGWSHSIPPLLHPCWRLHSEGVWIEGSVLAGDSAEAAKIARDCIDYQYRVEVWELEHGRKYDPFNDGFIEAFDKQESP